MHVICFLLLSTAPAIRSSFCNLLYVSWVLNKHVCLPGVQQLPLSLNGHTKYMQNIHVYLVGWQVTKESTVVLAVPSCPMVKLDDKYYKLVDKMEALTEAPPSLLHAKSLTVKGPVKFVKGVVIRGDVTFENGEQSSVLYLTLRCIALWVVAVKFIRGLLV